ncbi:MAG: hypothetical protein HC803_06060 [Saprospiraceae bacterium]|nr:hypothetical protein [Saprospiraceae bacterium]
MINGNIYKWSDVSVRMLGITLTGITDVMYERKQEKTNLYGAGNDPIARSHGQNEYTASITLTLNQLHVIESKLAPGNSILDIAPFDIICAYAVNGTKIVKDKILECEFTGTKREFSNGSNESKIELELIVGKIIFNA